MNIETAEFLASSQGLQLLAEAAETDAGTFKLAAFLRSRTPPDFAAAVSSMLHLRKKAEKKFKAAAEMLFTRSGLEQASAEEISNYRTTRFTTAGINSIADLCCGIGGDSISFSKKLKVTGIDLNPARLVFARHNIGVYRNENNFKTLEQDITTVPLTDMGIEAFFIDPARRTQNGERLFHPESWSPKLSEILQLIHNSSPTAGIKCAPGIDHADIPAEAEAEFISYNGELRECILWFGGLKRGISRQATLLPGEHILYGTNPQLPVTALKNYIYEPDSAVIRTGLVELLGSQLGADKISDSICYLTADSAMETPFAKCFQIVTSFKFKEKELKQQLKKLDCGSLNILKRGIGVDIPTLQKKLKLRGSKHYTLLLTRSFDEKVAIIAQRC